MSTALEPTFDPVAHILALWQTHPRITIGQIFGSVSTAATNAGEVELAKLFRLAGRGVEQATWEAMKVLHAALERRDAEQEATAVCPF